MKKFFQEYGSVALGILALLVLIVMITPVGNLVKTSLQGTVQTFSTRIENQQENATNINMNRFNSTLLVTNLLEKGTGRIYDGSYGTCIFDENNNTYTINKIVRSATNGFPHGLALRVSFKQGHKYFLKFDFKSSDSNRNVYWEWPGYISDRNLGDYNNPGEWVTYTDLMTANTTLSGYIILKQYDVQAIETREYRNVQLYDLTEIYGEGNEPANKQQVMEDLFL